MGEQKDERTMSLWSANPEEQNDKLICKRRNRQPGLSQQRIRSSGEGLYGGGGAGKGAPVGGGVDAKRGPKTTGKNKTPPPRKNTTTRKEKTTKQGKKHPMDSR